MAKAPVARNAPRAKQVAEEAVEAPKPAVKQENPAADEPRRIDMTRPYNMVWHKEQKHYFQDGVIYDKVYKTEIKV